MIKSAGQLFPPFGIGIGINTGRFNRRTVAAAFIPIQGTSNCLQPQVGHINPGVQRFAAFRTPEGNAAFAYLGVEPQRYKKLRDPRLLLKGYRLLYRV